MPPEPNDWSDPLKNKKKLNQNQDYFRFFFVFKKWHMVAKNKHHIRKEHGPKPWSMGFPGNLSFSFRKIITLKMRQNLEQFGTKRIKYTKFNKSN